MIVISVALAGLAVLGLGLAPELLPALALAAVAPPLFSIDLAEHRLPNRLVVVAVLAGVAALGLSWLATGRPPLVPLLSGVIYGGVLLLLALFGGIGMGDVKLATALGLASPSLVIAELSPLLAFLLGGIAAVIVLLRRGRGTRIAFGPFLLVGYFAAIALAAVLRLLP